MNSILPKGFTHIKQLPLQGGQSQVDLVTDENDVLYVAKTVHKNKYREMETLLFTNPRFSHPYIIGGFVSAITRTHAQYIFEYCPHEDMNENQYNLSEKDKIIVLRQLALALLFCHRMNIIHGDVKLENILLYNLNPPHIKLCDFGLAFNKNFPPSGSQGTYESMSPEMICKKIDGEYFLPSFPSDAWSYGVMAFELLTGRGPPFGIRDDKGGIEALKTRILTSKIKWHHPYNQSHYSDLRDFIERLLRKNPHQRISLTDALKHPFLNPWAMETPKIIKSHNLSDNLL